jgi:lipid A disaccharide synthetase
MAIERLPHVIICVDFSGFNRRFAHAVRRYLRKEQGKFLNWQPKLVQYISPQVWASRPSRAYKMARDFDQLLSIFPFEKDWYARYTPDFQVEYVGHPLVDRYSGFKGGTSGPLTPEKNAKAKLHRQPIQKWEQIAQRRWCYCCPGAGRANWRGIFQSCARRLSECKRKCN